MKPLADARADSLYRDGVDSLLAAACERDLDADAPRVCGEWNPVQVDRHVYTVVEWYHDWLDRALAGDSEPPFPASELDQRTAIALDELGEIDGDEALDRFSTRADEWLVRAAAHRDLPFGFPLGTVTVAHHVGTAAVEWHAHAWDLDRRHVPSDPQGLFVAAGSAYASTKSPPAGWLLSLLVPIGARRAPWTSLLRQMGRTT